MRGQKDLRLVVALSLLCAVLALLIPVDGVALVFAVPLTLFLPGYAITAAAFARRELKWPQFLLFSVALSLAILVLGSLLLNYTGGIYPLSWAVLLLLVVLGACRAAALRRGGAGGAPRWPRLHPQGPQAMMLLGAGVAMVAALVLGLSTVPAEDAIGYSQLWVLPAAGSGGSEVQVGVRSQEQASVAFDLRVKLGTQRVVRRSFTLAPGETRLLRLRAPPGSSGTVPVIATLLRHNRPFSVYRRVKGSLVAPQESR
ncbi:MAG TPA: DUF1616 domain-containing protein [Solirubrobacterales bacterium]|nr:DUF1616 domain-containing protein [Solirubrobacterales bacterium]